jgi:quercetin dioxygenase-like cupin family protein
MKYFVRRLNDENWIHWTDEGYKAASSNMIVNKTDTKAVSCRIIKLESEGYTGMHSHERSHHVMILEGIATLETENESIQLKQLYTVKIPANAPHRFINNSNEKVIIQVLNIY